MILKKYIAELIGTFWLVFTGCGSAIIAASFPELGIGFVGVSLAFGLSVLTMAYAIGPISGCHLNPAVSMGVVVAGRMSFEEAMKYILFQIIGALLGAGFLYIIVSNNGQIDIESFASNGYGENSPMGFNLIACFIMEFVMTFFFLIVILGATSEKANKKFAGIAIGLALTLIHLVSIPVTNTSVNPARSTSQALFSHLDWPVMQLWLFWLAPILGAILAGFVFKKIENK